MPWYQHPCHAEILSRIFVWESKFLILHYRSHSHCKFVLRERPTYGIAMKTCSLAIAKLGPPHPWILQTMGLDVHSV